MQEICTSGLRQLTREVRLTGTPRETAEKTFQMDPQSGNYLYLPRDKKLVPMGLGEPLEGTLTKEDLETAERYRLWCQRVHKWMDGPADRLWGDQGRLGSHGRHRHEV